MITMTKNKKVTTTIKKNRKDHNIFFLIFGFLYNFYCCLYPHSGRSLALILKKIIVTIVDNYHALFSRVLGTLNLSIM